MNTRFFLLVGTLLMTSPAMAEMWVNLASQYCLDTDGNPINGGAVRMWKCVKHPHQGWKRVKVGTSNLYQLQNDATNGCLDTDGTSMNGAAVRMWGCANHPNQLWEFQKIQDRNWQLKNKASGYCLDTDGKAENGGHVRMYECVIHPNQSWTGKVWVD